METLRRTDGGIERPASVHVLLLLGSYTRISPSCRQNFVAVISSPIKMTFRGYSLSRHGPDLVPRRVTLATIMRHKLT